MADNDYRNDNLDLEEDEVVSVVLVFALIAAILLGTFWFRSCRAEDILEDGLEGVGAIVEDSADVVADTVVDDGDGIDFLADDEETVADIAAPTRRPARVSTQDDVVEAIEPPTIDLDLDETDMLGRVVTLTGTGVGVIELLRNGELIGTVTADEDGLWSYDLGADDVGDYDIIARAADDVEAVSDELNFAVIEPTAVPATAVPPTATPEPEPTATDVPPTATPEPEPEPTATPEPEPTATAIPEPNIPEVLEADGRFNTLLTAAGAANLAGILGTDEYTVFAPTDDAFADLPVGVVEALLANPDALQKVLLHHVIPGQSLYAEDVVIVNSLTTGNLDDLFIVTGDDGTVYAQNGAILEVDIEASNGVIHAIDSVLLPPADIQAPMIDESGVPIFGGEILTVVGIAEPGVDLIVELNGAKFGETVVEDDGTWLVSDGITEGDYVIIAYVIDDEGVPLAVSQKVFLQVTSTE